MTDVDQSATATTGIGDRESTVLVSVADATTTEGEAATIIVSLSGKVSEDLTISYTLDGEATSGDGLYAPRSLQVEIEAGMTTGTITVATLEDEDNGAEDTETLTVRLSALPNDAPDGVELGDATATITIKDDNLLTVHRNRH